MEQKIYNSIQPDLNIEKSSERFEEIYSWISLFDTNVYLIVFLMILVGGINMVTALLVTVINKTKFIGILKILGSSNISIKKIFLINGTKLIVKGLAIGNLVAIPALYVQKKFNLITLNSNVYYTDFVPVDIN